MAEFIRAGEADFPAGRLVPDLDQGRAFAASVSAVQKMVPPCQPPEQNREYPARIGKAGRLGSGYRGKSAAF